MPAGRKPKITKEQLLEALKNSHGLKTGAAELLGVAYNTIDRHVAKSEEAQEIIDHYRIRRTDRAEYKLDEAIERGEAWAVALVLKDHRGGRDRGYGNSLDVTSNGEKVQGNIIGVIPIDYRAGIADLAPRPVRDSDASGEGEDAGNGAQVGENDTGRGTDS